MTTTTEAKPSAATATKVTVERRNDSGELVDLVDLEPTIFGITPNVPLMHQVVTAQLAARRSGTQSTKTRAEVAGGGAKPYRQKGTGRARQGTVRAPQFAGGGVALGPKPRSYAQRTPRKMIRLALTSALSDRAAEGRVCVVDRWTFEVPKTKDAVRALAALGLNGRVLVVLGEDDSVAERSFANLQHVHLVEGAQLTAYEVLANDWVIFSSKTVPGGVTVSDASEPSVRSAAVVTDDAAVEDTGDTATEVSAPDGETADGSEADAPSAAGETAAGEAEADGGFGDRDSASESEARRHDIAVTESRDAAEALDADDPADQAADGEAGDGSVAAGSSDEAAASPAADAESGTATGAAVDTPKDEEDAQ